MSPGFGGLTTKKNALTVVIKASCGSTTPLGTPVDPEVYIIIAGSSLVGRLTWKLLVEVRPKLITSCKA